MRQRIGSALVIVWLGLCWTSHAVSWQTIAHYQIGVEAEADAARRYQMLPVLQRSLVAEGLYTTSFKPVWA